MSFEWLSFVFIFFIGALSVYNHIRNNRPWKGWMGAIITTILFYMVACYWHFNFYSYLSIFILMIGSFIFGRIDVKEEFDASTFLHRD